MFHQPGDLWRLLEEDKKALLIKNTANDIGPVTDNVKLRHCAHCYKADPEYGMRLTEALGLDVEEVKRLAALGYVERMAATGEIVPPRKPNGAQKA